MYQGTFYDIQEATWHTYYTYEKEIDIMGPDGAR